VHVADEVARDPMAVVATAVPDPNTTRGKSALDVGAVGEREGVREGLVEGVWLGLLDGVSVTPLEYICTTLNWYALAPLLALMDSDDPCTWFTHTLT